MEYLQRVDGHDARTRPAWQPGWQTAEDLHTEWHEQHGWASTPPAEVVAQWAAVQSAQDEYAAAAEDSALQCTVGGEVPAALFVPAHPQIEETDGHIAVELCRLSTGQPVVVAFTTLEGLIETLGRHQPWLKLPGKLVASFSSGILLVDPASDVLQKIWTKERLDALQEVLDD